MPVARPGGSGAVAGRECPRPGALLRRCWSSATDHCWHAPHEAGAPAREPGPLPERQVLDLEPGPNWSNGQLCTPILNAVAEPFSVLRHHL